MKVFINPGHAPGIDSGAVNANGTQEAEVALKVGRLVSKYLENVGIVTELLQSNSLNGEDEDAANPSICRTANNSGADLFISIHCNAFNRQARGTECCIYCIGCESEHLAGCIQQQIVKSLGTVDRGIKTRPKLTVLRCTSMPAVLVEMAFIDNDDDCRLLTEKADEFARAIARGVTDYELG